MISLLLLSMLISATKREAESTGLGIILGEPTGLSAKLWLTETTAIDGALAWSFRKKGKIWIHTDYLYHNFNISKTKSGEFGLYYGFGGRVRFEQDVRIGVRFVFGLEYLFETAPFDIFLELGPILDLVPATDCWISSGAGARFFF